MRSGSNEKQAISTEAVLDEKRVTKGPKWEGLFQSSLLTDIYY